MSEPLAGRVSNDADGVQIARAVTAIWQEIEQVLAPIIGRRGVDALFRRTLHLTAVHYPWISAGHQSADAIADPRALEHLLAQQRGADAAAVAEEFLKTFRALLASLIGESITSNLLRPVWIGHAGEPPAKDSST